MLFYLSNHHTYCKKRGLEVVKKCGNCGHLLPHKGSIAEKTFMKELINGVCELTGKSMVGSLIAGCFYWCDRSMEREEKVKKK
jgi:hypothetical protein